MPHHNLVTLIDLRHRHRRRLVHIRPVAVHAHSEIHLDPPDGDPSTRQSDFCRKMCRRVKVLGEDAVARRRGTAAVRFLLHHGAMRLHFVDDLREPLGAVGLHGNARRREIFSSLSDLNGGQLERAPELQNHVQDLGQEKRINNMAVEKYRFTNHATPYSIITNPRNEYAIFPRSAGVATFRAVQQCRWVSACRSASTMSGQRLSSRPPVWSQSPGRLPLA